MTGEIREQRTYLTGLPGLVQRSSHQESSEAGQGMGPLLPVKARIPRQHRCLRQAGAECDEGSCRISTPECDFQFLRKKLNGGLGIGGNP
ncbi:hypothetical protein GCM10007301_19030 [Azorhizobium oxalatiphilum]|uniref:Uncharacterized protein n=1 Tax=Azorhizobium oxalatiphilum TaxID=980631 RepID=A0A917BX36_9HYPH|nr:hypothetical protein GCM10007301_19030 [Azorhizobium oxalatiphilum]